MPLARLGGAHAANAPVMAMWIPEHRSLSVSCVDPVLLWKHAALEQARLAERERQRAAKRFISLQVTLGFAALGPLTQLFALQVGVPHPLAAAVVLPSMVLVQE
ncbi:MAG TPA: hypothetical protein VG963_10755, partial [Polyangiaceae bacterium]|nr:hypothetical protein [Polyangiaceae bacterium]